MRNTARRKGAVSIEFALVVPIVMLVVLGLMEWGRFEMIRQVTSTATFNGARLGTISGATDVDVEAKVNSILAVYFIEGATTTTNFGADHVTVEVQVPVGPNAFFLNKFFGSATVKRQFCVALEK